MKKETATVAVDTAAYLLLDDIGERICATWHLVAITDNDEYDEMISRSAELAVCSFSDALARIRPLSRLGILRKDRTVDPVVMKRLRAKGATIIGIGDEPSED